MSNCITLTNMNRTLLETGAMGAVGRVCETLSFDACRYAGAWLGLGLYAALGKRRGIAINNVRLALGVSPARANQIARRPPTFRQGHYAA